MLDLHAAPGENGYFRFFGQLPKNLTHIAAEISKTDQKHCAVGVFIDGRLIGMANYILLHGSRPAEVAMVVAHEDQQSGIGTELLEQLTGEVRQHGIEQLVADVISTNSTTYSSSMWA
ncbi:GNAT family N-acetyltransferase [Nocardia australiensis]|uniref:GNAT family N-acetyltransferase n=1 Tax=Nocardia australiensis TaxID=2887191 RepID=UPI001D150391|nr:GNAT family N-acetyltransferase [Nocardia australiensis]